MVARWLQDGCKMQLSCKMEWPSRPCISVFNTIYPYQHTLYLKYNTGYYVPSVLALRLSLSPIPTLSSLPFVLRFGR
jgi:hypothetical protein